MICCFWCLEQIIFLRYTDVYGFIEAICAFDHLSSYWTNALLVEVGQCPSQWLSLMLGFLLIIPTVNGAFFWGLVVHVLVIATHVFHPCFQVVTDLPILCCKDPRSGFDTMMLTCRKKQPIHPKTRSFYIHNQTNCLQLISFGYFCISDQMYYNVCLIQICSL